MSLKHRFLLKISLILGSYSPSIEGKTKDSSCFENSPHGAHVHNPPEVCATPWRLMLIPRTQSITSWMSLLCSPRDRFKIWNPPVKFFLKFMTPVLKQGMDLKTQNKEPLEHLHQRSVCEPAREILIQVHQSNPVNPLEDFCDPESRHNFQSPRSA